MKAYIAQVPYHFLCALQMIKQNNIKDCDLYYIPTSKNAEELVENAKKTGLFKNVYMLPNISLEYPVTVEQILKISGYRFTVRKILKDKWYDTVYYNSDGWLLNSIIFSSMKNKNAKNVFIENGLNPYITPYDSKEWYLRLFINASLMTCMDGKYINERYLFEPSLMSVPQSGEIKQINKIDCSDESIIKNADIIYGYDEKLDSFNDKDIVILEQGNRKEAIDMNLLWKKAGEYLDAGRVIVKSHPRQKESALRNLGYDIYERYVIPWEVLCLRKNMNDKTIIAIFSTACVTPKLFYNQEPRVILLYKLIGIDYSFFGEGMIDFVNQVGDMYNDKSRFFIPESWEEFEKYVEENNLNK